MLQLYSSTRARQQSVKGLTQTRASLSAVSRLSLSAKDRHLKTCANTLMSVKHVVQVCQTIFSSKEKVRSQKSGLYLRNRMQNLRIFRANTRFKSARRRCLSAFKVKVSLLQSLPSARLTQFTCITTASSLPTFSLLSRVCQV